jgi:hypothetical protein
VNHKAYVALTVHLEHKGKPVFVGVLKEFKINHKVIMVLLCCFWELIIPQMLLVTCNNASCNDTMVSEINERVEEFLEVNHIWCFMHIVILVAKSLLKQFDTKKAGSDGNADPTDAELTKLMDSVLHGFR